MCTMLDDHHEMGPAPRQVGGVVTLSMQGIGGDDHAGDVRALQQPADHGDLIRFSRQPPPGPGPRREHGPGQRAGGDTTSDGGLTRRCRWAVVRLLRRRVWVSNRRRCDAEVVEECLHAVHARFVSEDGLAGEDRRLARDRARAGWALSRWQSFPAGQQPWPLVRVAAGQLIRSSNTEPAGIPAPRPIAPLASLASEHGQDMRPDKGPAQDTGDDLVLVVTIQWPGE